MKRVNNQFFNKIKTFNNNIININNKTNPSILSYKSLETTFHFSPSNFLYKYEKKQFETDEKTHFTTPSFLFASDIPTHVTDWDLRKLFEKYGCVNKIKTRKRLDGTFEGTAILSMADNQSGEKLLSRPPQFDGSPISISLVLFFLFYLF